MYGELQKDAGFSGVFSKFSLAKILNTIAVIETLAAMYRIGKNLPT